MQKQKSKESEALILINFSIEDSISGFDSPTYYCESNEYYVCNQIEKLNAIENIKTQSHTAAGCCDIINDTIGVYRMDVNKGVSCSILIQLC